MKRGTGLYLGLTAILWIMLYLFSCIPVLADGDILMNERLVVPGDNSVHTYTFIPTANNLYTIRSFGEGIARASLYLEDEEEPTAEAEGFSMDVRLIADVTYRLEIICPEKGEEVEIMRCALGRSIDQPLQLSELGVGYDKAIARAYDTHWYKFTAKTDGLYVIRTESQINTVGFLLDDNGEKIALSDNLYSPQCLDFRITAALKKGRDYIIRVCGRGSETGQYHLVISAGGEGQPLPDGIIMSQDTLILSEGQIGTLSCLVKPVDAMDDVAWMSDDRHIAQVDSHGQVTAVSAGETCIMVSGLNNTLGICRVTVLPIPVEGITVEETEYSLHRGETLTVSYKTVPENASNRRVLLTSGDETIVTVQPGGLLAAEGEGSTTVTLTTEDGGFAKTVNITVSPARSQYRALLLGLQRFDDGDVRLGAVNTTQGIYDLLSRQSYDGMPPQVTMKLDMTRAQAVTEIREAFHDSEKTDVSILYINSHGGLTGRTAWIKFSDGKRLTAAQLERELRKVKGKVVLLLDCCQSGSFISLDTTRHFGGCFIENFSSGSYGRLASTKYCILASTSAAQDSYRLLPVKEATESSSATAFARSLCEAGGWDLIGDKATRARADMNQDHEVTLFEAYLYCHRRVKDFLNGQPMAQDVQLWPDGAQLTLFRRE